MNALIIVALLMFFSVIGIPVVFSMLLSSVFYLIFLSDVPMIILAHRMVGSIESFPLIAVPLFILAAEFMNRGMITDKIFNFANHCLGHVQGAMGHVNVLSSMIFAGMSGSEVADVAGLGKVEISAMKKMGYDDGFSAAITGASSIVGPIIPPSLMMIIYGSIAEESVGRLFLGGAVPGVLIGISLMVVIYIISKKRNYPKSPFPGWKTLGKSFIDAFPTLMTPIIILAGIGTGVFTPTESAVIAVLYSFILTFVVYRDLKAKDIIPILYNVTLSTAFALIIVGSAAVFGWMITQENVPNLIRDAILAITDNKWLVLFIINIILLVGGCFFAVMTLLLVLTPVIIPLAKSLGVDMVHLGVVVVLNLCLGFLSPPFGIGLYVLSDISNMPIEKLSRAMVPFFLPILFVLFLITFVPELSLWLPNLLMGIQK